MLNTDGFGQVREAFLFSHDLMLSRDSDRIRRTLRLNRQA